MRFRPSRGAAIGWVLFLCSGTASAVAAALATETFSDVPPASGAGFSIALAGLLATAARRPPVRRWSRERRRAVAAMGATVGLSAIVLYLALARLPLGTTITIEFLGPLSVAVFHARRARDYLAALGAVGGVALVSGAGVSTDVVGILFACGAAVLWAIYIVFTTRAGAYERPLDSLVGALAVAAAMASPLALIACFQIGSWGTVALLAAVAVCGRIMTYLFEILALRLITPGVAGVLFSIVPVIAALVGFVLLGQTYSEVQILGALIVVSASSLVMRDAPP